MLDSTSKALRKLRAERGQALILMVAVFTVIFLIAAIVIDFGLWFSERRGAQKDADASSLAGALELLSQDFVNPANNNFAAIQQAAEDAAYAWAQRNGVPPQDVHNLVVDNASCFGPSPVLDSVSLDVEHHSEALFSSIFGLVAPQIGTHARACLGSIVTAEGMLPVAVQISGFQSDCWQDVDRDNEEDPLFGQECILTFGAGSQTSGEAGSLRLYNDGSLDCSGPQTGGNNTYLDEIRFGGANTTCHVLPSGETCQSDPSGCVWPLTGVGAVPQQRAIGDLLAAEGECDRSFGNGNRIDEFLEVVEAVDGDPSPSPDTLFARRDCVSPRLVSLIIIQQFDVQGNAPSPIEAFASFFIKGCQNSSGFSATCQLPGGQGQVALVGFFVNILETQGGVGQISKWSPKRIILTE